MKRILGVVLAGMILLGTTACTKTKDINATTVYSGIEPMVDSELVVMSDTYISNYYGINVADLQQYVFAKSDDPKTADTIIIFKCQDNEKRKLYVEALKTALNQKYEELSNYDLPDEAKLVKNSKVVEDGDVIYIVIAENAKDINKIIKDSIE